MIFRFCNPKIHISDTATLFVWLLVFQILMTASLGAWPIASRSRDDWGMNWIGFLDSLTRKPYTRHQNCICTIYNSGEKWTFINCRPSWTPSWISQNCQCLRGDTIIFLETGYLLKRLTPLAYLYHFQPTGIRLAARLVATPAKFGPGSTLSTVLVRCNYGARGRSTEDVRVRSGYAKELPRIR